ncbi:MAG: hypothetical protein NC226_05630 [Bacteroides cellulosilyticus]|nr:hypothetical protein [Bacteroides cellulosilyticus]
MKTLKSLLYVLAAGLLFAGCSDDETYTAGTQENPDCYGVYFPSQTNIADLELDPADEPALSFTVRRAKSEGEITVPVTITSKQGENIFEATAIEFADGQEETTFVISFPDTEVGTTYMCEVDIDDPLYASTYTERSTGFSFTVTRVKWVLVTGPNGETTGKWRDDLFSSLFGIDNKFAEKDIEIYERGDQPGYYRIQDIYDAAYIISLFGDNYGGFTPTYTILDASDPEHIYLPEQSTGRYVGSDGVLGFASQVPENNFNGDAYGTNANGVITFPAKGVLANFDTDPESWYYGNGSGMLRIMLPGAVEYDYSLVLTNEEPENGAIKIGVKFGADVAKVKYAFFEGEVTDALADIRSGEIESGETASEELTATGTLTASFEQTGVYSMVANVYNAENELVDVRHISFGYVKAGDEEEKAVVITCGVTITDKYAPQGYTSEDSAEIYIYGKEIVSGLYALVESDKLSGDPATYLAKNGKDFTQEQLEKINGNGFSGVVGNLVGGTDYTLIVSAFNGYVSKVATATATTNGTPHPLKRTYTAADLSEIGGGKTELFKSWNLWAVDYYDEANTKRQLFGQAIFSENTEADVDDGDNSVDAINVKGMSFGESTTDDTVVWEYYNGVFYTLGNQVMGSFPYQATTLYLMPTYIDTATGMGTAGNYAMVGGCVAEGYMALVSNNPNYNFNGMLFKAYTDAEATNALGNWAFFYDIMFVDPAVDDKAPAAGAKTSMHSFRELAMDVTTPDNFVELRGRERMHSLIDELKANKSACNVAGTVVAVEMPMLRAAEATTKFEVGMLPQRGSIDTRIDAKLAIRVR